MFEVADFSIENAFVGPLCCHEGVWTIGGTVDLPLLLTAKSL